MHIPPRKNKIILSKNASLEEKLNLLRMLNQRVEEKINHFDGVRQQNLRYSILVFSGLVVFGFSIGQLVLRWFVAIGLTLLMTIFFLADKRLHRRTHAFRGTIYRSLQAISYLLSGGGDDITIWLYDKEAAEKAEKINLRLSLYCLLIAASILAIIPLCILKVAL